MQIVEWQLYPRKTIMSPNSVRNAIRQWKNITGIYLRLGSTANTFGWGEASPLEGYSPDTLEMTKIALDDILPNLSGQSFSSVDDIEIFCSRFPSGVPAARFAMETALLDLLAKERKMPLWKLFREEYHPVRVNALLQGDGTGQATASALVKEGISTFKIKIGEPKKLERELLELQSLRQQLGADIELRLDANGAIPASNLVATLNRFLEIQPNFIEEPMRFGPDFPPAALPLSFGADESLTQPENIPLLLERTDCTHFILKPSLLGGFFPVFRLAAQARRRHKQIVVTHMYESMVGFCATAHLAQALAPEAACGLYPYPALKRVPLSSGVYVESGRLVLPEENGLGAQIESTGEPLCK